MKYKVSNVCQLLDKSVIPATQTINGVTFTNNGDGSVTVTGTPTNSYSYFNIIPQGDMPLKVGHVYSYGGASGTTYVELVFKDSGGNHYYKLTKATEGMTFRLGIIRLSYAEADAVTFYPQFFDLTEMYGAGNEPITVAQFRADFPDEYYEYSPECWKRIRELRYVQETRNLIDKNTVKVIDGYVWSGATIINPSVTDKTLAVPCKPNTTYTVSKGLAVVPRPTDRLAIAETSNEIDKVGAYSSYSNIVTDGEPPNSQSLTITTTSTAKSLVITIGNFVDYTSAGTSFERVLANVQLEEGSTATAYQPYGYLGMRKGKYVADKRPVQLLDKSKFYSFSARGMTFTYNNDGSFTVNGTATGDVWFNLPIFQLVPGGGNHTYLFDVGAKTGSIKVHCNIYFYDDNTSSSVDLIIAGQTSATTIKTISVVVSGREVAHQARFNITTLTGGIAENVKFTPQLFDLTAMYGAGNEPTTVEKFRQDFPDDYYEYNPYNYKSFN